MLVMLVWLCCWTDRPQGHEILANWTLLFLFCTGILNNEFGRNISLDSLDESLSRTSTWKMEKAKEV